jgi:DNA-binding response OmpR family regulator
MTGATEIEILLVEDNPRDAELTTRALSQRNLANKITWVKDGAAALDLIFGDRAESANVISPLPKVVLLDLKLPKVDGLEVLRRIKSDQRTQGMPVVILTSSREERDLVRGYHLGANIYIVKPVSFENFSEAVAQTGCYWLLLNQRPENPAYPPTPNPSL